MIIERKEVEILNHSHLMCAEGCHDEKPTHDEIQSFLLQEGYASGEIEIWQDLTQGFWRWYAKIEKQ